MATLLLARSDIAALMTPKDYLAAVESGFRAEKEGRAAAPPPLHLQALGGGFHAKGAILNEDLAYAAIKLNGNFPANAACGLPTIQGAILLCDAGDGSLLAILDSAEVTLRRTAAATALAARYLANDRPGVVAIVGCGSQAEAQLAALRDERDVTRCAVFDCDAERARRFADTVRDIHGIDCRALDSV
ncbi:MAG: ornithine cyclodeaminase family protein, partial [Burkholderiales bacterium]